MALGLGSFSWFWLWICHLAVGQALPWSLHLLPEDLLASRLPDECDLRIVESIPEGLHFNGSSPTHPETYQAWMSLLDRVESRLELASSYWTLRGSDVFPHPSAWKGEHIFQRLSNIAAAGSVRISIAQDLPHPVAPNLDTEYLGSYGSVEVKSLNFSALMGAGILHTKLWLVDRRHFYVGSANFDWRSLTQVKEVGIVVTDCPALAEDMGKIFDVYWALGGAGKVVPDKWPDALTTQINASAPLELANQVSTYLSSSPHPFCPSGRTDDIDAILTVIDSAREFIHVAVMDMLPVTLYQSQPHFWPLIDDSLRRAAVERGVRVKILLSQWTSTSPFMTNFLQSLLALNGVFESVDVQGKLFEVPSFTPDQAAIPYARVNHNKYMVTDSHGYIGTSNWTPDYFISTGGIGMVFTSKPGAADIRLDLATIFDRDWNSEFAHRLKAAAS